MRHNLFNNKAEYLKWASGVCITSAWGGEDEVDEELRLDLKVNTPVRYPVITTSLFKNDFDRTGDTIIRLWEHVYLDEFTIGFDPYEHENKQRRLQAEEDVYWGAMREWKDLKPKEDTPERQFLNSHIDELEAKLDNNERSDRWMRMKAKDKANVN